VAHTDVSLTSFLLLLAAALTGGVANALAGGGTFLVFPTLLLAGLDSIGANATSAATMLPGGIASAWVYRRPYDPQLVRALVLISIAGGITGSTLLLLTPNERFTRIVPYLMLGAAVLFTFAGPIQRLAADHTASHTLWIPLIAGQYLIAVYGGYFGAGMGVPMIVLFLIARGFDVQQSAALRFYCSFGINGCAVIVFGLRGIVDWRLSIPMAVAAVAGGYWGAHAVKRMTVVAARRAVMLYAWATTLWLFLR
jgi:uncharacterized membrane protein YfcA